MNEGKGLRVADRIQLNYVLGRELWREFYAAHYAAERSLKARFAWGVFCLVLGAMGVAGWYEPRLVGWLLLATGLFGVLSKQLLLYRSMRAVANHPFLGEEVVVTLSTDGVEVRGETARYGQPWDQFARVRRLQPGLALYFKTGAFFFIPRNVLGGETERRVCSIVEAAGVPVV